MGNLFMDKRKSILCIVAAAVGSLLLCLLLYHVDNKYTHPSPQPVSGVLFLSEQELAQNPVCFPIREWTFFPDVLLTPEQSIHYDGYCRSVDIGGSLGMQTHGSGTYRLILILPPQEDTYALQLPEVFSACRLFVNGIPMLQLGDPSPDRYTEGIADCLVSFPAAGRTELLLNVSDFSGVYSGMTYPPAFGTPDAVLRLRELRLLLHGAMVLLALPGIALAPAFGLRGNRRRGILYGLLCLCLIGVVGYPLVHGLMITAFQPWYSIEISCLYALLMLAVLLQGDLCGLRGKKLLLPVAPCALGLLCAILRVGGAAFWSPAVGNAFSSLSAALKYYAAACLIALSCRALRNGNRFSLPLTAGSVALSACLLSDRLMPLYEPMYGGWFEEIGGLLLTISLGVALRLDLLDAYRFRLTYADGYRRMERQLSMQKEHYRQLSEQIQRSREASHDLRHHMRALRGIASEGNPERLLTYLDSYEPHLAEREITVWSDHPAADAVLCYYADAAKKIDAIYDVRLAIPPDLPFPDDELCILLGNLLENAIEAMSRQRIGARRLYLRGNLTDGRLGLVLDNTFDGVLHCQKEKYISSKHGGFGLGISSVRAITEKYGGLSDFSAESSVFHVSLLIPVRTTHPQPNGCDTSA